MAVASAAASAPRLFRLAGVPEHFNAPVHRAKQRLLDKKNILLQWTNCPGGTGQMCQKLRDKSVDAAIALTEGLVADLLKGNTAKIVATYVASPLVWGVHVPATSKVTSLDDLMGATYAVSRMGSGSHLMACVDAHSRGHDPNTLKFKVVGGLDGAREALGNNSAHVFFWEKFTTKFLVDSGEWRRIGEVPTPWPCFSIAATQEVLSKRSTDLLNVLELVREEAINLRNDEACARIIGSMYDQKEEDVREWLSGVSWTCRPVVSHATLKNVMSALTDAGVLSKEELRLPSELVSPHTLDEDP